MNMLFRRCIRKRYSLVSLARLALQIVRGGEHRRSALLLWRAPPGLFQPYGTTRDARYSSRLQWLSEFVADKPETRILSFGCSTGEEVFNLARYFTQARIWGVDIEPGRIRDCQRRWRREGHSSRLGFECAANVESYQSESYDLILAMAVFRHGALGGCPDQCSAWLRFRDFERVIMDFARVLRPGGLLVIRHANFRFGDTQVAHLFECLQRETFTDETEVTPIYGRDDHLLPGVRGDDGVYRKKSMESIYPSRVPL